MEYALYYYKRIAHLLLAKIRSVHQTLNASIAFSLTCALPLLRRLKLSTPYFDYLMKHSLSYNMATAVATTSADRASASEIRPSETVYNDRTRDLEH